MRYIPNIIPEKYKVLPEYFREKNDTHEKWNAKKHEVTNLLSLPFFLLAILYFKHFPMFIFSVLLGIGMLGSTKTWLESQLQFKYTRSIKTKLYAVLIVPLAVTGFHYSKVDQAAARLALMEEDRTRREQELFAFNDSLRIDSLNIQINLINTRFKNNSLGHDESKVLIKSCFKLARTEQEKVSISNIQFLIDKKFTIGYVKAGEYKKAIPLLDDMLHRSNQDAELLFNRALCYDKVGLREQAVRDLSTAMQYGSAAAEKFHNKINPERKRIVGTITRCCDGTTSNAKGRGACSWHGGVCDWNEPIYETYRKY